MTAIQIAEELEAEAKKLLEIAAILRGKKQGQTKKEQL